MNRCLKNSIEFSMKSKGNQMSNSDKIKAIELAAVSEFGDECRLPLRQIDCDIAENAYGEDSPCYRLDVQRGEVNSHTIFDLRRDITEEEIKSKFAGLNICYEEYMKDKECSASS